MMVRATEGSQTERIAPPPRFPRTGQRDRRISSSFVGARSRMSKLDRHAPSSNEPAWVHFVGRNDPVTLRPAPDSPDRRFATGPAQPVPTVLRRLRMTAWLLPLLFLVPGPCFSHPNSDSLGSPNLFRSIRLVFASLVRSATFGSRRCRERLVSTSPRIASACSGERVACS
jgi:hypothetical protein